MFERICTGACRLFDPQFDLAVLQLSGFEHLAKLVTDPFPAGLGIGDFRILRRPVLRRRNEQFQQFLFDALGGLYLDLLTLLGADHLKRGLHQIANHALHIAAVVADLGVFGGLDLDERRAGEQGQTPGDLCLADPRGPDHDDVLGSHLPPHLFGELLPAPAIAQGEGNGSFGVVLADDVLIELLDYLLGGQLGHVSSSTIRLVLV